MQLSDRICALVCAATILVGSPREAAAQDAGDADAASSVNIVISGSIEARCSVGGGGQIDLGEMSGRESVSAPFDLACNVPFDLVATSSSGGIVHERSPAGEGPFKGTVPYRLAIDVPGSSPQPVSLHGEFSSADMVGGASMSSGEAIAVGGGAILLEGQLPSGQELLAGRYRDSVTISINPRV